VTLRRSRSARPTARGYQVTLRDLEIIFAVGRMGQATSDQLLRLFFRDRSTSARRLAKLVALRFLDVHVEHVNQPNIHTLGSRAARLLAAHGFPAAALHRSRITKGLDQHLRMLNDVRVELVLGARARDDLRLEAFHADLDLRRAAGTSQPSYIPDAVVELNIGGTPLVLMLEIDTGTEGLKAFTTKVTTTVRLWRGMTKCWGAPSGGWRPLVFAPSRTRARALARSIVDAGGGDLWLVSEFSVALERGMLGPIFATAVEAAATPRGLPIVYRGALAPAQLSFAEGSQR
jgi:hypothetical protein